MNVVLQILVAWIYSHFLEYVLHRYFLHNVNRKKLFKPHFGDHHKAAKKGGMIDKKYVGKFDLLKDPEIKGLLLLAILHFPIYFYYPVAYATLILNAGCYYIVHRLSHRDIHWARNNLSWHYDHHMAPDQHSNWGVRLPFIDYLFGTRKKYKESERDKREYKRRKVQARIKKIRLVKGDDS